MIYNLYKNNYKNKKYIICFYISIIPFFKATITTIKLILL